MSDRMSKVSVSVSAAQPLKAATADQGYAQGPGLVPGSHYPVTGAQ